MDLAEHSIETLLQELATRGACGVMYLASRENGAVEFWWGDRLRCLGLATRLVASVNRELDSFDALSVDEDDEDTELLVPLIDACHGGQYL